jgi:tRNA (adenine22-N1)-methyltransferase
MIKISKRLKTIDNMITEHYQSIWDCCCDHGLLGLSLLKRKAADNINFVDIVPSLTTKLERLLQQHFNSTEFVDNWQVHCIDVAELPLATNTKQLVIIAGVGGELLINFIEQIISNYQQVLMNTPTTELEFIICPVHHNYQVRQALIKHNFALVDEYIVHENKRFYEILHIKTQFTVGTEYYDNKISATGDKMWVFSLHSHQQYLTKIISHYQRLLLAEQSEERKTIKSIIAQYSALFPAEKR